MDKGKFTQFYICSLLGVFLASFYPIIMGSRVIIDMISYGTVRGENYPKYIIPYTPISIAVILGVLLMPLILRYTGRFANLIASAISAGTFFLAEILFENMVIVTTSGTTSLENWQTYLCAVPPEGFASRTWTTVNILGGEFDPAYKIHFYVIALVLILSILNCFYGFAHIVRTGDKKRLRSLVLQAITSGIFLGLCIWACYTAFYRGGELQISQLSAWLMSAFFVTLGVTVGIFAGSFFLSRRKLVSVFIPAMLAADFTIVMYIGELILLHGNLYRFGTGFFFDKILFLAPVDFLIIILSGAITALILLAISPGRSVKKDE